MGWGLVKFDRFFICSRTLMYKDIGFNIDEGGARGMLKLECWMIVIISDTGRNRQDKRVEYTTGRKRIR